ncbi:DUF1641 domain-containing protein [Halocalculus aciditolerans]|uniref:DUF1641 domain-containing protein n=1 Tax=Halocalculus aciditolerans TaxID=1383812 RepID=A0A830FKJ2_9EURY|nr:DUF1641 domain-containing protein [Halocalculus aciditolerans]GGL64899.1 hypothetical protein GCM10009039_23550 [Halocalculus aciditolerans]
MAKPTTKIPDSARNVDTERPQEGEEALRAVLETYGGDYADAAEYTDELEDILETAVLVLASADDDEVDYVTDSVVTLVQSADAISNEGTVALAEGVGENSDELADALDSVIGLQKSGDLDALIEKAPLLAELDIDETTIDTLNRVLDAVDEAEKESEPTGLFGAMRALSSAEGRAGLGYAISVLKGIGSRLPR